MSVLETVYRGRDSAGAVDQCVASEAADRHDRRASEETSELQGISDILTDGRNYTDCRCLLVDHADCHLIGDDAGYGSALCVLSLIHI